MPDTVAAWRTPYQQLLGDAYDLLHPHVRAAHETPLVATGAVDVVHGTHPLTPLIVRAMKLPPAGPSQAVTLRVARTPRAATMTWMRQIGRTPLHTRQFVRDHRLFEQSGPGTIAFTLRVEGNALVYEPAGCRILHVPLPRRLSPRVRARVAATATGWRVEVAVEWREHLICRYGGVMEPVRSPL